MLTNLVLELVVLSSKLCSAAGFTAIDNLSATSKEVAEADNRDTLQILDTSLFDDIDDDDGDYVFGRSKRVNQ